MGTIKDLIALAESEVGYLEKKSNAYLDSKTANAGNKNYTKYARDLDNIQDFYNGKKNGYAWCAVFVDWLLVQTFGVERTRQIANRPNKSLSAGCESVRLYYQQIGRYFDKPEIGDQVIFRNNKKQAIHTGIVYNVDSKYVYTIEGNTDGGSKVIENGGAVCKKQYKLGYKYIDGYGRPMYSDEEKNVETFKTKYVYDVDDEGLVVHKQPGDNSQVRLLKAGTMVNVYENQGYWSRIGENEWVWSFNLSDKMPKIYTVKGVNRPPLNVRNKASVSGKVVGGLKNGDTVQIYKKKIGWAKVSKQEERWVASAYLK